MEVSSFSDLEEDFTRRVHRIVWCNVASIDRHGRPRSRVLHPLWEGQIGWIATHRHGLLAIHLHHQPSVSLAYIADAFHPIYVDCTAKWIDDLHEKRRVWDLFKDASPPLGYDPATFFERVDHPNFGVLKLTPWRIVLAHSGGEACIWHLVPQQHS
ncbi:MAG TPA: hypothetical protein VFN35_32795 [Ktedonobacteraceae bacterium]|nr:hypothetical protein [Ktedonobacteraceae bacterium]